MYLIYFLFILFMSLKYRRTNATIVATQTRVTTAAVDSLPSFVARSEKEDVSEKGQNASHFSARTELGPVPHF